MSDWDLPSVRDLPEQSDFIFKAHYRERDYKISVRYRLLSSLKISAHVRRVSTFECICLGRRIPVVRSSRPQLMLTVQKPQLELSHVDRVFDMSRVALSQVQLCNLLVRLCREHEPKPISEAQFWRFAKRWDVQPEKALSTVRGTPSIFVSPMKGWWTLTPWVRLNVVFQPLNSGLGTGPHSFYEVNALQFWLLHRHTPSPEEEWHPGVRETAKAYLNIPPLPRYFFEKPSGHFIQDLPSGKRRLGLKLDYLPEGKYFSVPSPQGQITYSVEGRAFLVDGPFGTNVINAFATLRMHELLARPGSFEILKAGQAFLEFCRAARISAK